MLVLKVCSEEYGHGPVQQKSPSALGASAPRDFLRVKRPSAEGESLLLTGSTGGCRRAKPHVCTGEAVRVWRGDGRLEALVGHQKTV